MNSTSQVTHDEIAQRAHDIWEQCGRLDGHELDHWYRAERELRKERMQAEELRVGTFERRSRFADPSNTDWQSSWHTPERALV